ncbi:MAG: hypothetical protein AAGL68_04980 [Pseudomonadota bacterium]
MLVRYGSVAAALTALALPNTAQAMPPDMKMAESNAQCNGPSHIPIVEVEGNGRGKYGSVKTRELWTCIAVNTGSGPPANRGPVETNIEVEGTSKGANTSSGWRYYTMPFAYVGLLSDGGTYRQDPVELCNDLANSKRGQARRRFIKNGDYINVAGGYRVTGQTTWKIRRSNNPYNPNFHRTRHEAFERSMRIPALIRCLPTDHFATTSRTTSTTSASNADIARELERKRRERERAERRSNGNGNGTRADPANRTTPAQRTNPKPTVKRLKLTIAPANVERVGNWRCPKTLRLRGRVNVRRAFEGNAIFTGTQWLSRNTKLDFDGEGGRYVVVNHPLSWQVGGLTGSAGTAPRKQLSFAFNVSDSDGDLKRSKRENITVICNRA